MKKAPLRRRVGQKLMEWSRVLMGIRSTLYDNPHEAAPSVGPSFLEAMEKIPTVFACVNRKALDMARVPLLVGRVGKGGTFKPMDPARDEPAILLAGINPMEGPASFWARAHAMKILTGDMFIQLERLGRTRPQELWLLRSHAMTIKKGEARRPLAYEYEMPGTSELRTFGVDEIFHSRFPNPGNDWRGLSQLSPAAAYAWIENKIAHHHIALLDAGGVPPGWLKFKGYVSPEDRAELRAEVKKRHTGERAKYELGILWDDADYLSGAVSAREGEFGALSDLSRENICAALGVPPIFVMNLEHASYANALQQKELYWQNTLIPELSMLAQDLTEKLWRLYGDEALEVRFDYESVGAIQDIRLARAEALQRLVAGGLYTQNEARLELGKPKATGGDALYFPQALAPTGTVVIPQPARALPAFGQKAWLDDPARHEKRAASERDMASFVPEIERVVVDLEKRIEAQVAAAFAKAGPARTKDDDTIDWDAIEAEYETTLGRAYAKVVGLRGQAALDGVIDDDIFDLTIPGVAEWIENVAGEQGKLIVGTMKDDLRTLFAESDAANETSAQFSARLREFFDLRRDQANRIAWTETGKAYNFGTLEGFRQSQVVAGKEWLSALLPTTRDAHREADGQKVGLEEFFLVDGELLEHPGAPGGSADNVINCACSMQPVIDEEAKAARQVRLRSGMTLAVKDLDELFAEPSLNGHTK